MKGSSNGSAKPATSDLRRERRHFTSRQKVSIVKQHLVDGMAVRVVLTLCLRLLIALNFLCPFRDTQLLFRWLSRQAAGFLNQETSDGKESAGFGEGSVLA